MGRIDVGSHRITTDERNEVVCPWNKGNPPKGYKKKAFMSHEASYMCRDRHLHKVGDFPQLSTNDIKDNQIYTRSETWEG